MLPSVQVLDLRAQSLVLGAEAVHFGPQPIIQPLPAPVIDDLSRCGINSAGVVGVGGISSALELLMHVHGKGATA